MIHSVDVVVGQACCQCAEARWHVCPYLETFTCVFGSRLRGRPLGRLLYSVHCYSYKLLHVRMVSFFTHQQLHAAVSSLVHRTIKHQAVLEGIYPRLAPHHVRAMGYECRVATGNQPCHDTIVFSDLPPRLFSLMRGQNMSLCQKTCRTSYVRSIDDEGACRLRRCTRYMLVNNKNTITLWAQV